MAENGYNKTDKSDYNEDHKDTLFIQTTVGEFLFGGYRHGVLRWAIDYQYAVLKDKFPQQITKENGFAVFNGKNDTAFNEYVFFQGSITQRVCV